MYEFMYDTYYMCRYQTRALGLVRHMCSYLTTALGLLRHTCSYLTSVGFITSHDPPVGPAEGNQFDTKEKKLGQ